ncbi:hypothetical protein D1007_32113 [Hordeum vulgare]|nr:hypothetical protein D1007_32113 [Hordeum vulgare]
MGEEWRAVARRAPTFLEPVIAVDEGALDARLPMLISGASDALRQRHGDLAQYRSGVQHIVDPLNQPVRPALPLWLHTAGARFLALYGERLGFLQPAPAWERDLVLLPGQDPAANWHWEPGGVASLQGQGHGLQAHGVPEAPPRPRVRHRVLRRRHRLPDAARPLPALERVDTGGRAPRRGGRAPGLRGRGRRAPYGRRRLDGGLERQRRPKPHLNIHPASSDHGRCDIAAAAWSSFVSAGGFWY